MEHLGVPVGEPEPINSPRVFSTLTVASTLIRMKNNMECASGASSFQTGGKSSARSKQSSAYVMSIRAKRLKTMNESEASSSSLKSSTKKDSELVDSRLRQGPGVLAATPMSSLSSPATILRKTSRSSVSKEKKTKAPRASKSLKVTSSKSLATVPKLDVPVVEQDESVFSPLKETSEGPVVESVGPNIENANRIESHVAQPDQVAVGATESAQPEQGVVLTLVASESAEKDSLVAGKVTRVELPAELEPRPAPKPVEVVGKGKDIATPVPEEVSEATGIVDLVLDQVKFITAEKLTFFESWSLERLSSKYNETLSNSALTREWKKRVANEKKVLKWAKTSEVAEALKKKDLVEACLCGRALFSILEARKANFNPVEKGSEIEVKVLKRLDDIMDNYVSVASRYVHGANCSGAKPFDDDEPMDILDADDDADELDDALLFEFGNLSAEEIHILDQPIQENPHEEEVIVQEPKQALETNEEEVIEEDVIEEAAQAPIEENSVISPVLRTEEAQEKVVEVTQPEIIISDGDPSKDKDVEEESSSSEEEQDQYASYARPLLFPNTIVGSVHENVNNPLHYSGDLYERFQRAEKGKY
ncbi:uncharacterized abhydrolase domain-containing protein DDB_G0269086-like [Impatiens glandulifera]|uniref:uncharacterized abhydrolase domain-containing protein DDB_G0269086-like n=1 Tax=Impatiens glandulifera TaxID=253017 RepID=UPI001FB04CA1|nr:uncharacterized abhydrolase domain-containing protein DDB_G0269086-like [Impatiens glandulifera]